MITAAAVTLTSQISAKTGDWMSDGLETMFEAMGVPEEHSKLAAQIFVTGVVVALSVGAGIAGAVAPAANIALSAIKFVQAMNFMSGAVSVTQGVAGITAGVYAKDAALARADAQEQQVFIEELALFMQDHQGRLRKILDEHVQAARVATETLASNHKAKNEVLANSKV